MKEIVRITLVFAAVLTLTACGSMFDFHPPEKCAGTECPANE